RKGGARDECPCRRSARFRHSQPYSYRGAVWLWPRLSPRRAGTRRLANRSSDPRAGGLVSTLFGLSPLLPKPPPTDAGLRTAGGCFALPRTGESWAEFLTCHFARATA